VASFGDLEARFARLEAVLPSAVLAAANEMPPPFVSIARSIMRLGHPLHTQTPSMPGTPPAWISGALKGSFVNTAAVLTGDVTARSLTGPTVRYARIQELGGMMRAHNPSGFMHWQQPPGVWHRSRAHSLPPRPYMRPANAIAVYEGGIRDAAGEAFGAIVDAVL